jgi:death-on-curing protein
VDIRFLTVEDALQLHADQVAMYGGEPSVRDRGLLESALAQPRATYDGRSLHGDLFEMAAAYMFHIVQNHPFVDGNKRAGLIAALVFLIDNGIHLEAASGQLYSLTIGVASGDIHKPEIAAFFRSHAR